VLERTLELFLPENCDYRGFFLCQGAINKDGLSALKRRFESSRDEETLQRFEEFRIDAHEHPDEKDFENARMFTKHVLSL